MRETFARTWAVAQNTACESLRQPIFFVLIGGGAATLALLPQLALFHLGESFKMVVDLGLSTVLVFGLFGALLVTSAAVSDELENLTALTVLSKPVRREEFLVGKYLGVMAAVGLLVAVLGFVFLVVARSQSSLAELVPDTAFLPGVIGGLAGWALLFGVLAALRLWRPYRPWAAWVFGVAAAPAPVVVVLKKPAGEWFAALAFLAAVLVGLGGYVAHRDWRREAPALPRSFFVSFFLVALYMTALMHTSGTFPYGSETLPLPNWDYRLVSGPVVIFLELCVMSALAVAAATRLRLAGNVLVCTGAFLLGHLSPWLMGHLRDPQGRLPPWGAVLRTLLPDFGNFAVTERLAVTYLEVVEHRAEGLPPEHLALLAGYALLYSIAGLLVAFALFKGRELR